MALGISWMNIPKAFGNITALADLPIRSTYDMLFNNKSIDQVAKTVADEAAESFEPYTGGDDFDLEYFGEDGIEDIHAVDKALYQRDNPSALLTPWGPALDLDGIDAIIDQNPGVDPLVGIGGEERVELMGEADDLMNQFPEFMGELWEDAEAAGMGEGIDPLDAAKKIIGSAIDSAGPFGTDPYALSVWPSGTAAGDDGQIAGFGGPTDEVGLEETSSLVSPLEMDDELVISELKPPVQMGGFGFNWEGLADFLGNVAGVPANGGTGERQLTRDEAPMGGWTEAMSAGSGGVEKLVRKEEIGLALESLLARDPQKGYFATDSEIVSEIRKHIDAEFMILEDVNNWLEGKGWLDEEHPKYLLGRMMAEAAGAAPVGTPPGGYFPGEIARIQPVGKDVIGDKGVVGDKPKDMTMEEYDEWMRANEAEVVGAFQNIFYEYLDQTKDQFGTPLGARQDVLKVSDEMFLESEALFWLHGINNKTLEAVRHDAEAIGELYAGFLVEYMDEVLRGADSEYTSGTGFDNAIWAVGRDMAVAESYANEKFGKDKDAWARSVILIKVAQRGRSYGPKGEQTWMDKAIERSMIRGEGPVEIFKKWTRYTESPYGYEENVGLLGPMDKSLEELELLRRGDPQDMPLGAGVTDAVGGKQLAQLAGGIPTGADGAGRVLVGQRAAVPLPPLRPLQTFPSPGLIPRGAFSGPEFYDPGRALGRPRVVFPDPVPAQPLRPLRTFPSPGLIPRGAFSGPEFYDPTIPSDPTLPIVGR